MNSIFHNFSDSALKVIQLAHQITNELGHSITGTEHILLGILADETCMPSKIMKSMGITYKKTEEEVLRLQAREIGTGCDGYDFTPRAKALMNLASENTEGGEDKNLVEPEDLLLALVNIKRCTAQKVIHALDIDLELLLRRLNSLPAAKLSGDTTTDQLSELHKKIRAGSFDNEEDDDEGQEFANDQMIGFIVDQKYEIEEVIGRGGMGVVYKVRHLILDRHFAIKILHPYLASDTRNKRRFQREAQAASRLTHPNLATVFDWDLLLDGRPYLVMYHIEGIKLSELIGSQEKIPLSIWMSIFIQISEALAHAHNKGVIHRDLKPGNIILSREGNVSHFAKIVDFGIAKLLHESTETKDLTKTGEVFGSPLYMSPEQCLGHTIDNRSDIYSFGCVMYEILTSSPPFIGDSLYDTMKRHVSEKPEKISKSYVFDEKLPPELEYIILKCLNKNADARPQNMDELKTALVFINNHYFKKES